MRTFRRSRLARWLAPAIIVPALALGLFASFAPSAQAAPAGPPPPVIECVSMTIHTSGQSTAQLNRVDIASILLWVQTERDTHTNKLCGVRTKATWNAGSGGYSGSVQVSVCWTNVGGSCPGGQPAWYTGSDTFTPYQAKTYYTSWDTSETCGPYGSVSGRSYGTPSGVSAYGMVTSCP